MRSDAFNVYGYAELEVPGNAGGVMFHPEVDMQYLDAHTPALQTPYFLKSNRSPGQIQVLGKISSIAIAMSDYNFDFNDQNQQLQRFTNLEKVFVAVDADPQRRPWVLAAGTRF